MDQVTARPADSVRGAVPVENLQVAAYQVPTDRPEADGTLSWSSTTIVIVQVRAGGHSGLGYSYNHRTAADLIADKLADLVKGRDALAIGGIWAAMNAALRNIGRRGVATAAVSAVDVALWDLKARILGLPLLGLLGAARPCAPVYGSGGFTSYDQQELEAQLGGWVEAGIGQVKMKVGSQPEEDPQRVRAARAAIGPDAKLFVDANGAYDRKQALALAEVFAREGVSWLEEPVSSDDLEGLRLLRDRVPPGMEVAAGEYGYTPGYFRRMLDAGAVDVLQVDGTRCGGITGFVRAAALCEAFQVPISAHTAPAIHAHPCCAVPGLRHIEYFHDHVRIEGMFFDGGPVLRDGALWPDPAAPGHGLTLREPDVERYRA
jgi:L-alanine-DL-glutamate epimerase-like enolase superfamily enzyme